MSRNLSEPVRDLLTAVLEALDLPHPASVGGTEAHDQLLATRASHARIALRSVLDDNGTGMGPAWDAQYLRERLAEHPITGYVTADQAHERLDAGMSWSAAVTLPAGEGQCRRCEKPFDPADTRFDGHAQHKLTPYCRSCIDLCHDGGTEHVCRICDPKRYGGEDQ